MTNAPHRSAKCSQLGEDEIIELLEELAPEAETVEDRIWSMLEKRLIEEGAFEVAGPATLADQLRSLIGSYGLYDVLESLAACCDAKANEFQEDLYWAKAALLIRRAVPVSKKLAHL